MEKCFFEYEWGHQNSITSHFMLTSIYIMLGSMGSWQCELVENNLYSLIFAQIAINQVRTEISTRSCAAHQPFRTQVPSNKCNQLMQWTVLNYSIWTKLKKLVPIQLNVGVNVFFSARFRIKPFYETNLFLISFHSISNIPNFGTTLWQYQFRIRNHE